MEYVWYAPEIGELMVFDKKPKKGQEHLPHDLVVEGKMLLFDLCYIGEL